VQFVLDEAGTTDMYVVDENYGLPREGKALLNARPKEASASQDGDTTIFFRHIRLESQ
jgi:hypothetical protein